LIEAKFEEIEMKALRLHDKRDLRVDELDEPSPGRGEVLVHPILCGICGTDLHEYAEGPIFVPRETNRFGAGLPQILGHEFSARVASVGEGVKTVRIGDRVSIQPQISDGHDYFSARNLPFLGPNGSIIGLTWPWGGMAQSALVREDNAIKLPDDVSDIQGALVEPTAVAVRAVDRSGVQPGGSLLITGGGPIGALVLLAARAAGITRIVLSDPQKTRRDRIVELGTNAIVVDPSSTDVASIAREISEGGVGVDGAIDCAGNAFAIGNCIDAVRAQGVVVLVGLGARKLEVDPSSWTMRDITVRGSLNYPLTIWPRIFELMRSGLLPAEKIVDGQFGLEEGAEAFNRLLDKENAALKLMIDPNR
jgi:(R,R)-butanediol dehydrogenase / meso-butanediol dehydrogenase / diacetyl reductase